MQYSAPQQREGDRMREHARRLSDRSSKLEQRLNKYAFLLPVGVLIVLAIGFIG